MKPVISIIIPTKNEEANIARCIRSAKLAAGYYPLTAVEVILVDNYSTDKTVAIAKKLGARVFQKGPERSPQKNFGAKKATGQILFFVDADMEINLLVIQQAIRLFKKNPKIKAIIVPEVAAGENFWARARALEMSCYLRDPVIEAARIFDKKTFFRAGGFDEKLIAAEDWDFHQRIQKLGKIGRIEAKLIHHEDQLSLFNHLKKKYYYAKNIKAYASKHPKMFILQSAFPRVKIFLKNWRLFVADPPHTLGLFILKSFEYSVYLLAKCQKASKTPPGCPEPLGPELVAEGLVEGLLGGEGKKKPTVSAIFPTFNGWKDTKECLESIRRLNYPKNKLEIIIVDNASTDDTVKFIKELTSSRVNSSSISSRRGREELNNPLINNPLIKNKSIKLIKNKKNLGFAKAVNKGLKKANGDYLLITNNDVVFEKNYLKYLVGFLENNPMVGMVGGKVYYKSPKHPKSPQYPKKAIAFGGARFNFYTGLLRPNKTPNQTSETDWVSGCNLLVRKKVLDKISLFDENFFFYFEDLDLCLRAQKAGYQVIYYPKAILWHGEGASINRQNWRKKSQFYYQGKTRILFKHATKIQLVSALLFQFLFGLHYQFLILKHQNYTPAIKALVKNAQEKRSFFLEKKIKKFYDRHFFNRSLELDLRYFPIVKAVKKHLRKKPTILEVGPGDYGLTTYLKYPITGADLKFTRNLSHLITPVRVKDTNLPFQDNQFDIVISVHMLEHVEPKDRAHSLFEMLRVAKKHLFIAVPEGKKSEEHDQSLPRLLQKASEKIPFFLEEHLKYGLPRTEKIIQSLHQSSQRLKKPISIKVKSHVNLRLRTFHLSLANSQRQILNKILWAITPLSFLSPWLNFGECYGKIFLISIKNR